jgi:hypothetical protein
LRCGGGHICQFNQFGNTENGRCEAYSTPTISENQTHFPADGDSPLFQPKIPGRKTFASFSLAFFVHHFATSDLKRDKKAFLWGSGRYRGAQARVIFSREAAAVLFRRSLPLSNLAESLKLAKKLLPVHACDSVYDF